MMSSFILLLSVVIVAAEAVDNAEESLNLESSAVSSYLVKSFKSFLEKSLEPEGTYHRTFLISTGIVPPPPNYRIPREDSEIHSKSQLSMEAYDFFIKHVTDVLSTHEKLEYALNKVFGEHAFSSQSKDTEIIKSTQAEDKSLFLESRKNIFDLKQNESLFDPPSYKSEAENEDYKKTKDHGTTEDSEKHSKAENLFNTQSPKAAFTSDYIKFLSSDFNKQFSHSSRSESLKRIANLPKQSTAKFEDTLSSQVDSPFTGKYIQFLTSGSTSSLSSKSSESDETKATEFQMQTEDTDFYSTESAIDFDEEAQSEPNFSTAENLDASHDGKISLLYYPKSTEKVYGQINKVSSGMYDWLEKGKYQSVSTQIPDEFYTTEIKTLETLPSYERELKLSAQRKSKQMSHIVNVSKDESTQTGYLIQGIPGQHFPNYYDIPNTSFTCENKKHIPGFYADQETRCQVFHVCWPERRESFLCPLGTTFNQAILACDYWYKSNCSVSPAYFDINTAFREEVTSKSGTTGPMVDALIKDSQENSPIKSEIISATDDIAELFESDVHFSETVANRELSKVWNFLPIKAKAYIQSQPEISSIKSKLKKSKEGTEVTEHVNREDVGNKRDQENSKLEKETFLKNDKNTESLILKVLKSIKLSSQEKGLIRDLK